MALRTLLASALVLASSYAHAQDKPIVVHNQDTSYVATQTLDSLLVTPKTVPEAILRSRETLAHGNAAHKLANASDLQTTIPGVSADLERDLPGLISFYTPNGMPILTKQTQNHSLNSTIPYTLIEPRVSEPDAATSGPDAIVTYETDYDVSNFVADPLHQGASISTGEQERLSAAAVIEHASPWMLERLIPQLDAYANTQSAAAAAKYKGARTQVQVQAQHARSDNEFGSLFDVKTFRKSDWMTTAFINAQHELRGLELEAGYGHQRAHTRSFVDQEIKQYEDNEHLHAHSYKAGIARKNTRLSAFYHDVTRALDDTTTGVQDLQLILAHNQRVGQNTQLQAKIRTDTYDDKTHGSASLRILHAPAPRVDLEATLARLHDPVVNHNMDSSVRDATAHTQPLTTKYAALNATYTPGEWKLRVAGLAKNVELAWYQQQASINGVVARAAIERTMDLGEQSSLAVQLSAARRWLQLRVEDKAPVQMPGPAPMQAGLRAEYATPQLSISADMQAYSNRTQSLDHDVSASLGRLFLLNVGLTHHIGNGSIGVTLGNGLGQLHDNKMFAYQKYTEGFNKEIDYVVAPAFVPRISGTIDF